MLLNTQIRFMIQQPVQNISRIAHANIDDLGVKWRILIGDVGIELQTGFAAILGIGAASAQTMTADSKALTIP